MTKWAFLFPGQGSQQVGMGHDLKSNFRIAAETFAEADDALSSHLSKLCFEGPESDLKLTENTQPAILTVSMAVLRVLSSETGVTPVMAAGHSLGEYSALVSAGALSFTDAVRTVRLRGRFMQEAVPVGVGSMAAVLGLDPETVEKICQESGQGQVVHPANFNCPGQIVISGHTEAVQRASQKALDAGAKNAVPLAVSAPFHSSLMKPAADRLSEVLAPLQVHSLNVDVISNFAADVYPSPDAVKDMLTRQVYHPVRWQESMQLMLDSGIERFLELGPGRVLSGLLKKLSRQTQIENIETTAQIKKIVASI